MKKTAVIFLIIICLVSISHAGSAIRPISDKQVQEVFGQQTPPHPRLLLSDTQLQTFLERIELNPLLKAYCEALFKQAQDQLDKPPVERVLTGRRLLGVSRDCLQRVLLWSIVYRINHNRTYLQRAEYEMLAAAAFSDWNPSHFLDVAEMTAALSIGYDWLYNDLSEESRQTIRRAILEKGLRPSVDGPQGYFRGTNNWTQVCNGGITLGALAIMEDQPELAEQVVLRAVNGVQVVMEKYEPDGAYPEGPGYWDYGTTYNVILLAALESVLGTDFGLSQKNGFSKCAEYYLHVCGPTGLNFNYPDSRPGKAFTPAVFWFAEKFDQPEVAFNEYRLWQQSIDQNPGRLTNNRMAPLTLLWADGNPVIPKQTTWMGRGENPVALFRTAWTPDAVFLGFKAGSPGVSHGHMDVGSFVIDVGGFRWAVDLGPENYHKIESMGMNLWGMAPDSDRWKIFRYNNFSHNTLVVNGKHQVINATAPIVRYATNADMPRAVIDMSAVYAGQLEKALRGAALLPSGQVLIQDEFKAPSDQPAHVRWAMATPAEVILQSNRQAQLKQHDKTMQLEIYGTVVDSVKWKIYPTNTETDYDEPNPGIMMLGFEIDLEPNQQSITGVLMTPPDIEKPKMFQMQNLLDWSKPVKE